MRKKYTNHKNKQSNHSLNNEIRYPKMRSNTWPKSKQKYHMIPKKKYEKSKITHSTKKNMVIRKGGYFPRRLYMTAIAFGALAAFFISIFTLRTDLWFLLLFPIISLGLAVRYFYKKHIRFGEKISINKNRIIIEFYGSSNKKIQFKTVAIKSMTCIVDGQYHHFKIYKTNNSSVSFSILDTKKQDPLSEIIKFTNLEKVIETTSESEKVTRYWSRSIYLKRKQRVIEDISEKLYEYRSDYFSITSEDNNLAIDIKGFTSDEVYIDNTNSVIHYQTKNGSKGSIPFEDIRSIEKIITETEPIKSTNRIKIKLLVNLKNTKSIEIIEYRTHEAFPAEMEIIDMNKDFDNLAAIIDMNIKASIDKELETLDLDTLIDNRDKIILDPLENTNDSND